MHGLRSALPYCLILVFSLAATCGCKGKVDPASHVAKPRVRVSRPLIRSVTDYAYFTGRTDAIESVNVQARVTGYLVSIDFQPGARVEQGQRLFLIDPRPYQAALDRTIGQVNLAKARLELAIADYARALEVAKTPGAISQQDIDKYAAQKNEAQAAVAAAKANSESARLNLEFTRIMSPVEGIVGRNLLTIGNLITQDETLLTTVVSQDPIYAYFDIDEHTMLRVERLIREGKIATIREKRAIPVEMGLADESEEYPHDGVVDFVNNRIDPATGTLQIRGVFSNPSLNTRNLRLLKPGMFVRIRLPTGGPHRAIVVPQAAICSDQGKKYLLAVHDGVVEYRPVTLGAQQPEGLQVAIPVAMVRTETGLRAAESEGPPGKATTQSIEPHTWIIVGGLQQVRPGMKVEMRKVEVPSKTVSEVSQTHPATAPSREADEGTTKPVFIRTDGRSP
jgi:multidrug efflux system membrane fusion protein